jgi:RNA polymerase sigma-70 factor (ECF subfamily)
MKGTRSKLARPTLEVIYRDHFAFVWRSLFRLGVPERDLEDAAHDVFVVVHAKLAEFDFENRVTTWLYAICLRVASDRRRSGRARFEVLAAEEAPTASERTDGDSVQVLESHRRKLLSQALDALPLEQRAVFTLFELDELDGDEIARLLSVPVATVHSRLRLARETVRRTLARLRARDDFKLAKLGVSR